MKHNTYKTNFSNLPQSAGFTLLEMVIVIILLAIIASVSSKFFTNVMSGYADTEIRVSLSQVGRIAVEKVTRELRNALPESVRISSNCIEFIPILATATYQNQSITYTTPAVASSPLPVSGETAANSQVDVFNLTFNPVGGTNHYLVVYPTGPGSGSGDPYSGSSPGVLFAYSSKSFINSPTNSITRLVMSSSNLFLRQSPTQRLFIVTQPISFCITAGGLLNRHVNYGINATQVAPPVGTITRIVDDMQLTDGGAVTPFTYTTGSQQRNALVTIDLRIKQVDHLGNDNWIRMNHEVQVRNVP